MPKLQIIQKTLIRGTLAVVISLAPALSLSGSRLVSADAGACTPPADSTYGAGVHHPTGSDASMYTYDCTSGSWNNAYYTYNPATNTKTPTYSPNYSYDCATSKWYKTLVSFSPADGTYHTDRVVSADPGLATGCPVVPPPAASTSGGTTPSTSTSGSASSGSGSSASITNTGPDSTNAATSATNVNATGTNNNTLSMDNGLNSIATTGDAGIIKNTSGGDATTGDAATIANIANLLQTSSNIFGPNTVVFNADINGDVTGDFMFDPSAVMNTGPGSSNSVTDAANITVNQANNTDAGINNTVTAGSSTGNATVADNTKGGDATSGNANTVVNLMNLINSSIGAGKSFVGNININGDLNGDILLPQGLIDQMLASSGPSSSNSIASDLNVNATDQNNTTATIANNVNATAQTGDASVTGNTSGGSAKSGAANTNLTVLNLTGSQVVGADDILVFVNVLGQWVGMIMNAPAGSTAASLGGGITSSGPSSTNNLSNSANITAAAANNTNLAINNTVNADANSGNASVTGNTKGGNASSGDAKTGVNILNVANSTFNLSSLFGILFINVFGNWTGSFGVNTSAGDPAVAATGNAGTGGAPESRSTANTNQFAAFASKTRHATVATGTAGAASTPPTITEASAILGSTASVAKKIAAGTLNTSAAANPTPDTASHASYALPLIGFGVAALILLAGERDRLFRHKK